ncbi:MAG: metallophosphoesterase [Candidatus Moranbacteria bacterium]|nr:metallophosphoesterase [Candidatus Moranbacteria bacterium]
MKNFLILYQKRIAIFALVLLIFAFGIGVFVFAKKTKIFSTKKESFENISSEPAIDIPQAQEIESNLVAIDLPEESTEENIASEEFPGEEELQEEVNQEEVDEAETEENQEPEVLPLPSRNHGSNELRIGFLTDLHADSSSGTSRSDRVIKPFYTNVIDSFIKKSNNELGADFLILNGDVIDGTNRDDIVGMGELRSVKKLFEFTQIKKYWIVGNHDLRAVNKKQWKNALEIDYLQNSFDIGNYRVIILDSSFDDLEKDIKPGLYFTRGNIPKAEIDWLENKLKTDKIKVIFVHNPPLYATSAFSNAGTIKESQYLQQLFFENDVTAVFCGHLESLYHEKKDGVEYFMIPGAKKNESYQGTFAEIILKGRDVDVDINYLDKNGKYKSKNTF